MTSGGARARSGPPADPMAQRRKRPSDQHSWVHLPPEGRVGDAPPWPLPGRLTKFEKERWAIEWRRPQALMWERLGLDVQVATYIRQIQAAASPKSPIGRTEVVLRLMTALGLSVDGLAAHRWIIDEPTTTSIGRRVAPTSSSRERMAVLAGAQDDAAAAS